MKKRTKVFAVTRLLVSATAAAVFALAACAPVTGPEVSGLPPGKGLVNIRLGIDGDPGPARTLVPGSVTKNFSSYKLIFTSVGSDSVTLDNQTETDLTEIALATGTYTLNLTAYAGSGADKKEAAAGTVTEITVNPDVPANVSVPLVFKPGAGDGKLLYSVNNNSGFAITKADITMTSLPGGSPVTTTDWLYDLAHAIPAATGDPQVPAGYYLAKVELSTSEGKAVRTDIVHIGAGQTTTLNWTFVETDFSTVFSKIWLVGSMNEWTLPGTEMTQAANGTFTWEGLVSGIKDFRFSLLDTSTWPETDSGHTGDNRWWGHWFAPTATVNSAVSGSSYNFDYYHYTKKETKWILAAEGYYRLIVNPQAKTLAIEAPPVVTEVAITGGIVSLNKGSSHAFAATVNGHNNPSQGVTWSVRGASDPGTAFSENTLTIAASETVGGALTIRATSTADTTKYVEITVTVQEANSPVVSSITVSAAGNVTEVQRTGSLQFTPNVTASGDGVTQDVTWSVSGKDKDGKKLDSVESTINENGLLTVDANEAAVDLVVRATSKQAGFETIYGEASVFVRKLGAVFLIGDEFGNWTDTGPVELTYANRGVYTTTQLMSKARYFRFKDNSSTPNHFEPAPYAENQNPAPSGTVDAERHESTQSTSWKTTQGGSYEISLNTVTEKVTFTLTPQVITITSGPSALAPGESGTFACTAALSDPPVAWAVYGDHVNNHDPQEGTQVVDGTLTLGGGEWIGHTLFVTATSLGEFVTWEVPVIDGRVWLVGVMNSWALPSKENVIENAIEMERNGAVFTWTGSNINGDSGFRFTVSEGSYDGEEWKRDWLVPHNENTTWWEINTGNGIQRDVYRKAKTKIDSKWTIAEEGNYTISLNLATKKLTVTKN
jgi:hypothetical protein